MPKPEDLPDTPDGDKAFFAAVEKYNENVFENPIEIPGFLEGKELEMAKQRRRARLDREAKVATDLQEAEAELREAVARIDPVYFADMNAEEITKFAPVATLAQLKAVMAAKHWTREDKRKMLGTRWDEITWLENSDQKILLNEIANSLKKDGRSTRGSK